MKRTPDWWDRWFLGLADYTATASKDPSTRVGCALVNDRRHVIGMGMNGFPRGVADCPTLLNDRPQKLLRVIHAEVNAVLNAEADTRGCTAYVTHPPCSHCSGVLIQAGIRRIVTREPDAGLRERFKDSFAIAETMLAEAGVELVYLKGDE